MNTAVVKAVRHLRTLSPDEFKLAVALARPDSLRPGPKPQAPRRRRRKQPAPEATE